MGAWQQWIRRPQTLWVRKALFQIHLWTGLGLSLYLVMLSVTGSALVYRVEMTRWFDGPRPVYDPARQRLSSEELTTIAQRLYPGWAVTRVGTRISRRNPIVELELVRGQEKRARVFDPYTGADLNDALPAGVAWLNWTADLHDELLLGLRGRRVNAVASGLSTALILTGAVIWWPGARTWRRSLRVAWSSNWRRFNWDLHSALGAWFFLVLVLWGVSGVYLAFPEPFADFVDRVSAPEAILGQRRGDVILAWMARLHFGRFRDMPILQPLWVVGGLVPAVMCVTGAVMWWNRLLRRRPDRPAAAEGGS